VGAQAHVKNLRKHFAPPGMRRNVRDRVMALAPFLSYDSDPYIVLGDDGRLSWVMDAFTVSDSYPYSSGC